MTLPRNGTVIVFADGEIEQGPLHANFELHASGSEIVLTAPTGQTNGGLLFGKQRPNESLSWDGQAGAYLPTAAPTPGDWPHN
jgi:hypothetical protein